METPSKPLSHYLRQAFGRGEPIATPGVVLMKIEKQICTRKRRGLEEEMDRKRQRKRRGKKEDTKRNGRGKRNGR